MKQRLLRIIGTATFCCAPLLAAAQTIEKQTHPQELYREGSTLFAQKNYAALVAPLQQYLRQTDKATADKDGNRQEADYMLACAAYELQQPNSEELLHRHLTRYPASPHANRIKALIASTYFFKADYATALSLLSHCNLDLLNPDEQTDMTYRLATCYLQNGNLTEAAAWYEAVRATDNRYAADCTYYLAYIRYTQQRYEEALQDFRDVTDNKKYAALAPYYISEILLQQRHDSEAADVARNYLNRYASHLHAPQMHRILATVAYRKGDYLAAMKGFDSYLEGIADAKADTPLSAPRRDALYMVSLSRYHCAVYSRVAEVLMPVTTKADDELTQNAFLHMGLAYLQLGEKNNARMSFEQAADRTANRQLKEQAAYNYALCIHETSFSAFGESVNVFENFLNEFPQSAYADKVSSYLVEVYMTTRSYEAALQSINRIGHPTDAILEAKQKILFQLGTQAFANTTFEAAANYFRQSISLGRYNRQTQADAYYWLGESAYRMKQYSEATAAFNQYLTYTTRRTDSTYALASYNLGYIAFHQRNYAAAESRFTTYLQQAKPTTNATTDAATQAELSALQADAYNRLGDCFLHNRRFDEATAHYAHARQLHTPAGDYATYQMALVAGLQKKYSEKVALLSQLASQYPTSPYLVNALYEQGRSYVQTGSNAQAIATFEQLAGKYPDSPIARKAAAEIGLLYYMNEDYNRAIDAYKHVITRYPGSDEARLAMRDLKNIYVDANRVDEFAALASSLPGNISFEPTEQDSLTYIAAEKVYMRGEKAAARNSFQRYLQSYPNGAFSLNANYYLAAIAHAETDEEAVLRHTSLLLQYPDSPYSEEALLMHAEVLFNRTQYAEAMTDYRQLQAKASTPERRQLGSVGVLRCAALTNDHATTIHTATTLLAEDKLTPELKSEALYRRAHAYLAEKAVEKAETDFSILAADTRTLYGAEAKYRVAQLQYNAGHYPQAEKEILDFIEQSTPHAYWLARGFVLLSDVYVAMNKPIDARQYLLSLQQNYQADDDIAAMIDERLAKLKE